LESQPLLATTPSLFADNTPSEEESAATTAAYASNAIAMRKARTAGRRASLTVGASGAGAGVGGAGETAR